MLTNAPLFWIKAAQADKPWLIWRYFYHLLCLFHRPLELHNVSKSINLLNILSSFATVLSYPGRMWNIKYLSHRKLFATQTLSQTQKSGFAMCLQFTIELPSCK